MDRQVLVDFCRGQDLELKSLLMGFVFGLAVCYIIVDMSDNCMPQGLCRFNDNKNGGSYDFNCKELLPLMCDPYVVKAVDYSNVEFKINKPEFPVVATTSEPVATTTTTPSTTSTTLKVCPTCPDCVCSCPLCTRCQICTFEPTQEQIKWMLNYKPNFGSSAYQAGGFDTKDEWLDYLQVPGRPKFKSRPSDDHYRPAQAEKDCLISFKDDDCNGDFYINNTIWMISGEGSIKWVHKL